MKIVTVYVDHSNVHVRCEDEAVERLVKTLRDEEYDESGGLRKTFIDLATFGEIVGPGGSKVSAAVATDAVRWSSVDRYRVTEVAD